MNKKRNTILGIGFVSLVIFSIIIMVIVQIKNDNHGSKADNRTRAYVAVKHIALGQKITLDDIELRSLPQDYVGSQPLDMTDIVDHYASVEIMKSDLIRSEKLSFVSVHPQAEVENTNGASDENATKVYTAHDVISMPLSVFKNPDTTLKNGEYIDILGMSVFGDEKPQFSTRYIALHVAVKGFLKEGKNVNEIVSVTVDEKTQAVSKVYADEILLDMPPRDIASFLSTYYRTQSLNNDRAHNVDSLYKGHMWMVKCNPVIVTADESMKRKMMGSNTQNPQKPKATSLPSMASLPKLLVSPSSGIVSYEQ